MSLKIGRTQLRIHPLALMFPLAMVMLGVRVDAAALLLGLIVHEGAHLLAARWLGVGVRQLRLMPFGGAIGMDNPYALAPSRLFAVAAAGPAANLLALTTCAALAHWQALPPRIALASLEANLTLMLFNLLPALPLDGGRMLYALMYPRIGRARAVELGIWAGRAVAAALMGLAAYSGLAWGRFNLSWAFAAVFILSSAPDERQALAGAQIQAMLGAMKPLRSPVPARIWAVSKDCSAQEALSAARAEALNLYAVYDGSRLTSLTDDRRLLNAALNGGAEIKVGEVV